MKHVSLSSGGPAQKINNASGHELDIVNMLLESSFLTTDFKLVVVMSNSTSGKEEAIVCHPKAGTPPNEFLLTFSNSKITIAPDTDVYLTLIYDQIIAGLVSYTIS